MKTFSQIRNYRLNESVMLYASKKSKNLDVDASKNQNPESPVIGKIENCVKTNVPQTFKLSDGTAIQITPMEAKNVMYTYEELNDENRGIFENYLQQDIDGYALMIDFCNSYVNWWQH